MTVRTVVPTPDYVRFASHYGFGPDFCHGNDPQSKGLGSYCASCGCWGVNSVGEAFSSVVGQVGVVQAGGRLLISEPFGEVVADHPLQAPGEASVLDDHYDGPRPAPSRGPRP